MDPLDVIIEHICTTAADQEADAPFSGFAGNTAIPCPPEFGQLPLSMEMECI